MKSLMIFCLVLQANSVKAASKPIDVIFVTQSGSRVLKSWTPEEIQKFAGKKAEVSAQKFLFEESTSSLVLNDLASIDLVTITTESSTGTKTLRVPRFLVWRGFFQFKWNPKTSELASYLKSSSMKSIEEGRMMVPAWYFDADHIRKIELSDHLASYPQTKLKIRTNPAASRGEKIFTQNCLACHSVSTYSAPTLNPAGLTSEKVHAFTTIHKKWPALKLDGRSERGLIEYSEAMALEQNEVKVKK